MVAPPTVSFASSNASSSIVTLSLKVEAAPTSIVPYMVAEVPTCIFSVIDAPAPTSSLFSNVDTPTTLKDPAMVVADPTNNCLSSSVCPSTNNSFSNVTTPFSVTVKSSSMVVIPVTLNLESTVEPAPVARNPSVNSALWKKLEKPNTIISPWNLDTPLT